MHSEPYVPEVDPEVFIRESKYESLKADSKRLNEVIDELLFAEECLEQTDSNLNQITFDYERLAEHWLVKLGIKLKIIKLGENQ